MHCSPTSRIASIHSTAQRSLDLHAFVPHLINLTRGTWRRAVQRKVTGALLLCIGILICLAPLPYIEITSGHEAREGMRLRAMLAHEDWFFPDVLRKPPLYYWLSGFVAWLRGGMVDALSLRLPSGILAILNVLLIVDAGQRATTREGARWAGFLLFTAPLYIQQSHSGRTDMTLCFFVTASLLLFFLFTEQAGRQEGQRSRHVCLFFGALACASLTKGPVATILVAVPIASFLLWRRDWRGFRLLLRPGPVFFFGILVGGWYALGVWHGGEQFWRTQVLEENVARFTGGIDRMSPFYYIGPLFGEFAPWSLALPFALWRAVKERKREPGPFFLALWWFATVLFFQAAAYKRARYLLPTLPPAALLVGWWLVSSCRATGGTSFHPSWRGKLTKTFPSIVIIILVVTGMLALDLTQSVAPLVRYILEAVPTPEVKHYAIVYTTWVTMHFWEGLLCLGVFTFCLGLFVQFVHARQYQQAASSLLGSLILIYIAVYPSWLIVTGKAASPQTYTQALLEKLRNKQTIAFVEPYDERGAPVLFALQTHLPTIRDVQWPWGTPQPHLSSGYYLVTESRKKELVSDTVGTWTEILQDPSPTQWPVTLFYYKGGIVSKQFKGSGEQLGASSKHGELCRTR